MAQRKAPTTTLRQYRNGSTTRRGRTPDSTAETNETAEPQEPLQKSSQRADKRPGPATGQPNEPAITCGRERRTVCYKHTGRSERAVRFMALLCVLRFAETVEASRRTRCVELPFTESPLHDSPPDSAPRQRAATPRDKSPTCSASVASLGGGDDRTRCLLVATTLQLSTCLDATDCDDVALGATQFANTLRQRHQAQSTRRLLTATNATAVHSLETNAAPRHQRSCSALANLSEHTPDINDKRPGDAASTSRRTPTTYQPPPDSDGLPSPFLVAHPSASFRRQDHR